MNAPNIALVSFIVISIIVMLFAFMVLWKIFRNDISLDGLLSEPGPEGLGKASLSRFQFLIFTFVVAGLFLLLSIEAGTFVDIPTNVLGLLGISSASYLVSKAVPSGSKPPPEAGGTTVTERKTTTRSSS